MTIPESAEQNRKDAIAEQFQPGIKGIEFAQGAAFGQGQFDIKQMARGACPDRRIETIDQQPVTARFRHQIMRCEEG